jgi:hypothetical protein
MEDAIISFKEEYVHELIHNIRYCDFKEFDIYFILDVPYGVPHFLAAYCLISKDLATKFSRHLVGIMREYYSDVEAAKARRNM